MKLTDLKCKASKPNPNKKAPTKISDGDGLYFVVHSTGKKTWRFDYRYHGKQKTMSFGPYPLISLKEARDKRVQARKMLAEYKDPILEKDKSRKMSKISSENTFEGIAREWYENRKHMWKPRYAKDVLKRLEEDVFPYIGNYPIVAIDRPLLLSIIRRIVFEEYPYATKGQVADILEHLPAFYNNDDYGYIEQLLSIQIKEFLKNLNVLNQKPSEAAKPALEVDLAQLIEKM